MMAPVLPSCRYPRYLYLHLRRLGHIFIMCLFFLLLRVNRVLSTDFGTVGFVTKKESYNMGLAVGGGRVSSISLSLAEGEPRHGS